MHTLTKRKKSKTEAMDMTFVWEEEWMQLNMKFWDKLECNLRHYND
jgi:hypothetical protein